MNQVLIRASTQTSLESMMPSEGSRTRMEYPGWTNLQRQKADWWFPGAWAVTANGDGGPFGGEEDVLELHGSAVCTTM